MPKFMSKEVSKIYNFFTRNINIIPLTQINSGITELELNVNENCNLSCRYCFAREGLFSYTSPTNMNFEIAKKLIDKLIEQGNQLKLVKFIGGEPLLNFPLIENL